MEFVAILIGSLMGKLRDPITWGLFAAAFAVGFFRWRPYWPFLVAGAATAITLAKVYSWWVEVGIANQWQQRAIWMLFLNCIVAYAGFGIGRLFPRRNKMDL